MWELESRFDAIDVRKDGKQDVWADFEAKKEAQRAFYQFAIKDAKGQIDMRNPKNIQLLKEVKALLERQDIECHAVTSSIEHQMQKLQSGVREELSQAQEQAEIQKLSNYFSIPPEKLSTLVQTLKEWGLNLDVLQLLGKYKKYIDENLVWLDANYLLKVKQSIGLRTLTIWNIVSDLRKKESDMSQFQNNKWIINEKVTKLFDRVDKAILPSCVFYIRYSQKAKADTFVKEYNKKYPSLFRVDDGLRGQNMELWLSETKKVLESPLDEEWNFKFNWFGFGTQIIFDERRADSEAFLQEAQIPKVEETNLLSEEDREIEKKAKLYFLAAVGVQIWLGTASWLAWPAVWTGGTLISAWIDATDMFSSTEVLMDILQWVWLVDPRYRMEKTLFDNFMAGLGIIPGISIAVKQQKIAKFLTKFSQSEVSKAIWETGEALKNWAKWRTKLIQELWHTSEDIKKYSSMSVEDMLKIATREEREKAAEIVLWQKLSQAQKDTIWDAHKVWKAPFSFSDIKEKIRILTKDNLFEEQMRKRLLQRWVCGEDEYYNLSKQAVRRYKERIPWLAVDDIIDYGANAVVVRSKMDGRVYKLPLSEFDEPRLLEESMNHDKFFKQLREWKKTKEVPENIHIPDVHTSPLEDKWLYSMQHIEWQTLGAKFTLRNPKYAHLFPEPPEVLNKLTWSQIKKRLKAAKVSDVEIDRTMTPPWTAFDLLKSAFPDRPDWLRDIQKAVDYLKKHWLEHTDFHAGNIMFTNKTDEIAKEGDIFIIDFWKVDIPSTPKPPKP